MNSIISSFSSSELGQSGKNMDVHVPGSITTRWPTVILQFHGALVILVYDIIRRFENSSLQKTHIHKTWGIRSSKPTSSASNILFVFTFCFIDAEYTSPFTINISPPLLLLVSWWTANEESTHNLIVPHPSDSRINIRYRILCRYLSIRLMFFLSPHLYPWLSLSGKRPWWVYWATPISSETGSWPQWYGEYVHLLWWYFLPYCLPQTCGWWLEALRSLFVFPACLQGPLIGIL